MRAEQKPTQHNSSRLAQVQHTVVQLTDNSKIMRTTREKQNSCTYIHIQTMTKQYLQLPDMIIAELKQRMTKHYMTATQHGHAEQ